MDISKAAPFGQKPSRLFHAHAFKNLFKRKFLQKTRKPFRKKKKEERLLEVFALSCKSKFLANLFNLTLQSNLSDY